MYDFDKNDDLSWMIQDYGEKKPKKIKKMAKKTASNTNTKKSNRKPKYTSIGRGYTSSSMMNKHKRRSYKKYRGQGR